jgi:hypothetical protein
LLGAMCPWGHRRFECRSFAAPSRQFSGTRHGLDVPFWSGFGHPEA